MIEEAGVPLPLPGDLFIAAAGAAARAGQASLAATMLVVITASLGGSVILFEVSRRLGRPFLLRIGRRFGFDADRAERTERWLTRHGAAALVVGRLIPGLRIVLTVAAGSLGLGRLSFLIGVAIASAIWAALYYALGYVLGAGFAAALHHFLTAPGFVSALKVGFA